MQEKKSKKKLLKLEKEIQKEIKRLERGLMAIGSFVDDSFGWAWERNNEMTWSPLPAGKNVRKVYCVGCNRPVHTPENFPEGYPAGMRLCCKCNGALILKLLGEREYTKSRISPVLYPPNQMRIWWNGYGKKISKALTIQSG